jgi:ubiquinone/menaquinone biosynthesis C-methylase UbiE
MSTEAKVAGHYTRGRLEEAILQGMTQAGKDAGHLTVADLATLDEFHVGGIDATREMAAQMELRPGLRLLDVGSGIGGPARHFAAEHGCHVTGIDLTDEFVDVAKSLTRILKLDRLVEFQQASALKLPLEPGTFDRAYMIHVGMNIADKAGVFREVRRVLKTGGLFAVFDILRSSEGSLRYPVPWALDEETSFVADLKTYRDTLQKAGFRIDRERSQKAFAIEFTQRAMSRMAQHGPPALGLQLLMGEKTQPMIANMLAMMQEGILEPLELFAVAI